MIGALLLLPPPHASERLVRIYGSDPTTADRVAIIVPGADTRVATFDSSTRHPGGAARALLAEATRLAPHIRLTVVAWLGYDSPPTLSLAALTDEAAVAGSRELRRTVAALHHRTTAPITLLCHSYGSYTCALAAPGLPISDLAFIGSPGVGTGTKATAITSASTSNNTSANAGSSTNTNTSASPTSATPPIRVWAGLGDNDWIKLVPKIKLGTLGFGTDPMKAPYGARRFETGTGGHSDYYTPGTPSLHNLTLIALGRHQEVTPEKDGS
uniref:Putative secreted protein n=1 Tax=Nonomuraea gerenzanensis TaxID=93944 RepID=A0A1M4E7X1_9ACTN|nr:putative secreted protein [Nonomuraea gerenzanensis]